MPDNANPAAAIAAELEGSASPADPARLWCGFGLLLEGQAPCAKVAAKVDAENIGAPAHKSIAGREEQGPTVQATLARMFETLSQSNSSTEPMPHRYRQLAGADRELPDEAENRMTPAIAAARTN